MLKECFTCFGIFALFVPSTYICKNIFRYFQRNGEGEDLKDHQISSSPLRTNSMAPNFFAKINTNFSSIRSVPNNTVSTEGYKFDNFIIKNTELKTKKR